MFYTPRIIHNIYLIQKTILKVILKTHKMTDTDNMFDVEGIRQL